MPSASLSSPCRLSPPTTQTTRDARDPEPSSGLHLGLSRIPGGTSVRAALAENARASQSPSLSARRPEGCPTPGQPRRAPADLLRCPKAPDGTYLQSTFLVATTPPQERAEAPHRRIGLTPARSPAICPIPCLTPLIIRLRTDRPSSQASTQEVNPPRTQQQRLRQPLGSQPTHGHIPKLLWLGLAKYAFSRSCSGSRSTKHGHLAQPVPN